jgi:hypothetical protein
VAAVTLLALAPGTGCAGRSTALAPTRLTITYALVSRGGPVTCPTAAVCSAAITRANLQIRIVRRRLRCFPPGGTYRDPRAACAAVTDYLRLIRRPRQSACRCPAEPFPDPRLRGLFKGRRVSVSLSVCTACGLGGHAEADRQILEPSS